MTAPTPKLPTLFEIPASSRADNCRSCRAIGYWITTAKGKQMLVEVDHSDPRQSIPTPAAAGAGQSHFIRCEQRDKWRKR